MLCCWYNFLLQSLDKGEGNVHSGATPPWLREDDNEGGAPAQIGPSEEEFLRHSNGTPPWVYSYVYMYTTNILTLGHYTNNGEVNSHPTCGEGMRCVNLVVLIFVPPYLPHLHLPTL